MCWHGHAGGGLHTDPKEGVRNFLISIAFIFFIKKKKKSQRPHIAILENLLVDK